MKELIADLNLTSQLEYSMQALRKEKVRPAEIIRGRQNNLFHDLQPPDIFACRLFLSTAQAAQDLKVRPAEIIRGVAVSFLNDSIPGELEIDVQIEPGAEQLCVNGNQLFHHHTLMPDHRRLLPYLLRQPFTVLQRIRISHHHSKGRADIVGNAGDPLDTCLLSFSRKPFCKNKGKNYNPCQIDKKKGKNCPFHKVHP